jgi:hypothetical protein
MTTLKMTKRREYISPNERMRILAALQAEITLLPDGTAKYNNPKASDDIISKRFSVSKWTVQNLRRSFFGVLNETDSTGRSVSPLVNTWNHIRALEDDVEKLKKDLMELQDAFTRAKTIQGLIDITPPRC